MEMSTRGWNRNMGTHRLVDLDLGAMRISRDASKTVWGGKPGLFKSYGEVSVAWKQQLNKTGNFRMQLDLTQADVAQLFKAMFGSEIDTDTLEQYGFTLSPDLQKKLLGDIKLADLTLGDLAGIAAPKREPAPEEQTPATIKPFRRS